MCHTITVAPFVTVRKILKRWLFPFVRRNRRTVCNENTWFLIIRVKHDGANVRFMNFKHLSYNTYSVYILRFVIHTKIKIKVLMFYDLIVVNTFFELTYLRDILQTSI